MVSPSLISQAVERDRGVVAIIDGKPRYSGVLGALMAMNLWLRLYRAPYEWPWAYFFLIMLQTTVVVLHAGQSLGLDASWPVGNKPSRRQTV